MGGLFSFYAFFERPDVFGLVGAVSPSVGYARQALIAYLKRAPFVGGRIYMDVGTHEGMPRDRDPLELRGEPGAYVHVGALLDLDARVLRGTPPPEMPRCRPRRSRPAAFRVRSEPGCSGGRCTPARERAKSSGLRQHDQVGRERQRGDPPRRHNRRIEPPEFHTKANNNPFLGRRTVPPRPSYASCAPAGDLRSPAALGLTAAAERPYSFCRPRGDPAADPREPREFERARWPCDRS